MRDGYVWTFKNPSINKTIVVRYSFQFSHLYMDNTYTSQDH